MNLSFYVFNCLNKLTECFKKSSFAFISIKIEKNINQIKAQSSSFTRKFEIFFLRNLRNLSRSTNVDD